MHYLDRLNNFKDAEVKKYLKSFDAIAVAPLDLDDDAFEVL